MVKLDEAEEIQSGKFNRRIYENLDCEYVLFIVKKKLKENLFRSTIEYQEKPKNCCLVVCSNDVFCDSI